MEKKISSAKKITIKSSDQDPFEVDQAVALESQTIKHIIEDICADNDIPLPNVTSKILAKVIEYCKKHVETPKTDDRAANDELKAWDAEFVKVDQHTLFDLILVSFLGCYMCVRAWPAWVCVCVCVGCALAGFDLFGSYTINDLDGCFRDFVGVLLLFLVVAWR